MASTVQKWLSKRLPQNFILKKPFIGTLILSAIWFVFMVLYRPLGVHGSRSLSLASTMAEYCLVQGLSIYGAARLLKCIPFFSKEIEWTIRKEMLAIILMLLIMGIALYFAGFIIEPPSQRWNISTFLDSCKIACLIGIIPLAFCTLKNYRYLFITEIEQDYAKVNYQQTMIQNEELISISSQLKKEDLSFYPSQLIYCAADGNYVVFHLIINEQYIKKMIRNSINNIEQQLTRIPSILRIHRAFIVNLKMVASKRGNTLGYQLKFNNIDAEIPVSRNNTKNFDQKIKQFR
jgi:LytTr DNA-binding domain